MDLAPWTTMKRLSALLLAAALLAVACGSDSSAPERTGTSLPDPDGPPVVQQGGTLVFGIAEETTGWMPSINVWDVSGYVVAQAFYDRLMAYDDEGVPRPFLAESLTPNDDFTEWTVGLREGVRFHDGTPFDADALVRNLETNVASPLWAGQFAAVTAIEALDATTVLVSMSEPFSTFDHSLTFEPGFMVAPAQLDDPQGTSRPVGTGPFVFEEWVQGEHLTVTRNEDYWIDGHPLLDGITFRIMTNSTSRAEALRRGELDIMEVNTAEQVAAFEAGVPGFTAYLETDGETTELHMLLNSRAAPFDDQRARDAVAHAVDRAAISEEIFAGRFPPANGPFKASSPWFADVEFPSHDPDRVRELVAGYEADAGEPLSFTVQVSEDTADLRTAQTIQQQVESLGIDMRIAVTDEQTLLVNSVTGNYEAFIANLLWGSQHPDREYLVLHSSNLPPEGGVGTNVTGLDSERLDTALDAGRATGDPAQQAARWAEVQEELARLNTFVFLVHNDIGAVASDRVRDVVTWSFPDGTRGRGQEQSVLSLYQIWLEG
jgi:peptide/nickel transport system substrate-binding protein